jgi:transposase
LRIQGTLNQHGYHSILQQNTIPSGLRLVGLSLVFQKDNNPTHLQGYLTKKESDGVLHQMTWPPQSPDLNPIEMVWDELDRRVKVKHPTSAQHMWKLLRDCWKSIPGEAG